MSREDNEALGFVHTEREGKHMPKQTQVKKTHREGSPSIRGTDEGLDLRTPGGTRLPY